MSQSFTDDCFASGHVAQTDMQNIENNFAALKSCFSGSSAPSNLVAGMWWFDTTNHLLKVRNEANDAWQSVWDLANNKPVITNLSGEITGDMVAAAIKDAAAGTASLRTLGTGAAQACAGNDSRLLGNVVYAAGDAPVYFNDTLVEIPCASPAVYYKAKMVYVARSGTLRIKFTINSTSGSYAAYGRIYRNGVGVGTIRSCSSTPTEYTEDIGGWVAGDSCEIYVKNSDSGQDTHVRKFRLYATIMNSEVEVLSW